MLAWDLSGCRLHKTRVLIPFAATIRKMASTPPSAAIASPESRRSAWGRWLFRDSAVEPHQVPARGHPWYLVMWLTGVDYFSTLGYQPGIALLAAGVISPIATAVLVGVTLLCAVPVYSQVAGRSYAGQGSIAVLENLLPGWWSKLMVLVLLGFASTDFVITMTLSASDAALHATQNPYLHPFLGDANLRVTVILLVLLAAVFLKGFREVIGLATAVCVPYLLLNAIVLLRALFEVASHPVVLPHWRDALRAQGDWKALALSAAILFPRLALGLSGFETGVSVMPLISGSPLDEKTSDRPLGRIRNTRKLLVTAALIMSVLLLVSSLSPCCWFLERRIGKVVPRADAPSPTWRISIWEASLVLSMTYPRFSSYGSPARPLWLGFCIWCRAIFRALG